MFRSFFCAGLFVFATIAAAPSHGYSALCTNLANAVNNRSVRCNLGNYFDATQCRDINDKPFTPAFLSVCRFCADKYLPATHPGYTNNRCESAQTIAQREAAAGRGQPSPQNPAPPPGSPPPSAVECNALRRAVGNGTVFCTVVNLYDANYCLAADGKTPLLASFLSRCPACRDKEPKYNSRARCDAPAYSGGATLGVRQPSSIRYEQGVDHSVVRALSEMIPGASGVFAQTTVRDFHALFKNPTGVLGAIAATFETLGSRVPEAVVSLDTGNTRSYGAWQINSASRMGEFLAMLQRNELSGSGVSRERQTAIYNALTKGFDSRAAAVRDSGRNMSQFRSNWVSVASSPSLVSDFRELQREYVKKTHFDICYAALRRIHPDVGLIDHPVIQENIWSSAVQHGPGSPTSSLGCSAIISRSISSSRVQGRPLQVVDVLRKIPDQRIGFHPQSAPRYNRENAVSLWVLQNM